MKYLFFSMITILMSIIIFTGGTSISSNLMIDPLDKQKTIILACESNFKHENVWGDHGRAYGIAQFHKPTFNYLKKLAGQPRLKWKSQKDQLWLFDWALRNGHAKNWSCYTKMVKINKYKYKGVKNACA